MKNEKQYVVGVLVEGQQRLFYATDSYSGGYPYFSNNVDSAERLTEESARNIIAELKRPNTKEGYLNGLLSQAVVSNDRHSKRLRSNEPITIEAEIYKIILSVIDSFEFVAQTTVDEISAAREEAKNKALAKLSADDRAALGF